MRHPVYLTATDYRPPVSFVVPVLNGGSLLEDCLRSIRTQDYPQEGIEIIVADGGSTDNTAEIAHAFDCRVVPNARTICESGVSAGVLAAKHDLVCFVAADNRLPDPNWLKVSVKPFSEDPALVATEPVYFAYERTDPAANRYCSLFGINDPYAFYLKKRDRLMATEDTWSIAGTARDCGYYYSVEFNADNAPTLGSQGFIIRKDLLLQTNHTPFLYHMDSCLELIANGRNRFGMMKTDIIHLHCMTASSFIGKLRRNARLFFEHKQRRKYQWKVSRIRLLWVTFLMTTLAVPLWDSVKGYLRKADPAWFLHPYFCFVIPFIYAYYMLRHLARTVVRGQ